jgi:hypothetical protein
VLINAHYYAFPAFDGIPLRGIYRSMKITVDKITRGKNGRSINAYVPWLEIIRLGSLLY